MYDPATYQAVKKVINETLRDKPKRIKMRGVYTDLKNYRVTVGISGKEAAKRLGMSYRNYYRIENGNADVPNYVYIMIAAGCMLQQYNVESCKERLCKSND